MDHEIYREPWFKDKSPHLGPSHRVVWLWVLKEPSKHHSSKYKYLLEASGALQCQDFSSEVPKQSLWGSYQQLWVCWQCKPWSCLKFVRPSWANDSANPSPDFESPRFNLLDPQDSFPKRLPSPILNSDTPAPSQLDPNGLQKSHSGVDLAWLLDLFGRATWHKRPCQYREIRIKSKPQRNKRKSCQIQWSMLEPWYGLHELELYSWFLVWSIQERLTAGCSPCKNNKTYVICVLPSAVYSWLV